jgi:RNA polymerase sigma-70 factor (sigma-E family)
VTESAQHETFDGFVAAQSRRLLHTAELLVGPSDAEDLVQSVLMRMYRRWSKIRQQDPVGYARRSLVNAAVDRSRRGWVKEVLVDSVPEGVQSGHDHGLMNADRDSVLRALSGLTARERAVVVLAYYDDLSEAQIAADLEIAPGTVKSTRSRALSKLRVSDHLTDQPAAIKEAAPR